MTGLRPILIAGPTASGKSAVALALADRLGGMVINADSQQVYADWHVLTARPGPDDLARAPHRLYGHVRVGTLYSVGQWLADLAAVLDEAAARGLVPIVVGGTGLYFKALTQGLAPVPQVPADARAAAEAELERLGLGQFAAVLAARDPKTAAQIDLANPMRVLRAWEVLSATGRGLADWRSEKHAPLIPADAAERLLIVPPRDWLYDRCNRRLAEMVAGGALDEVRDVWGRIPDRALPGMKVVGAPELFAHLAGETARATAEARAATATRRYAKRQMTWGRNQMGDWPMADPSAGTDAVLATVTRPGDG